MQQINFCHALIKPSPYTMSVRRAKRLLVGCIVLLVSVSVLQAIYAGFQQSRLSYFVRQEKKITNNIETLLAQSPKIKQVRELENTIVAFSEKINHKTNFIDTMTRYNAQAMKFKPANYLNELANAAIPSVWLTKIHFQKQGEQIQLTGFTLSAAQLTEYVARLQNEPDFKNKPFKKIAVTNTDHAEKMAFILSTGDEKP